MTQRRRFLWLVPTVLIMIALVALGWVAGKTGVGSKVNRASLTGLERQFADRMTGAVLEGQFTIDGREGPAKSDRYELATVEKIGDDQWRFNARITYGKLDVTLPVVVTMLWAGDTPMITMTDVAVPSLGTFTVRLLFFGDRYAGTWQHGQVGGQMFGRIRKKASA
jgi:hypothetical protein